MATVRTCDRCGVSCPVSMDKPTTVRAYTFDTYAPQQPSYQAGVGCTVADLCEGCASQIRKAMTEPLPSRA